MPYSEIFFQIYPLNIKFPALVLIKSPITDRMSVLLIIFQSIDHVHLCSFFCRLTRRICHNGTKQLSVDNKVLSFSFSNLAATFGLVVGTCSFAFRQITQKFHPIHQSVCVLGAPWCITNNDKTNKMDEYARARRGQPRIDDEMVNDRIVPFLSSLWAE